MLPAWATVAIALGAGLITALAALGGTWLQGRLRRSEQLRERMILGCDDFATGVRQGVLTVRGILTPTTLTDSSSVWERAPEAQQVAGEAEARLARVHLLLGTNSDAGKAAEEATDRLREAAENLSVAGNVDRARDRLDAAKSALAKFNEAARKAIHNA